jgi:fatty-acyl-CoA synthase
MTDGARAIVSSQTSQPLLNRTVGEQLRLQAATFADRPALTWAADEDSGELETLSFDELLRAAEAAAADIARHADPGDRIAVWAANGPRPVILEYASALAGTVITLVNTAWTDDEVEHALRLTTPRLLFAGNDNRGDDLGARAAELAGRVGACAALDVTTVDIRPGAVSFDPPRVELFDPFLIQFTSGTTGRAKAATLSHHAALNSGYLRALSFRANERDVWLNPVPMHHSGGSIVVLLGQLTSGGCYVSMPRFNATKQLALMRATGATRTGGVPTMLHDLLETPGIDDALAAVKSVGLGGADIAPSLVERIQRYGATVSVAYAQSECPMITQSDPDGDATHVATTVGLPVPHTELRIVGSDGRVVGRGEVGEVCVRSPLVMSGYWGMPEATSAVFDRDGYLHTGDLGSIDDHDVVRIQGRARDVIIRGGENIYPIEVEDVLMRHPAVDAAAVVGAPSFRWGEEVAAVIKLSAPEAATAPELSAHAAKSLAHFKIPRHWRFVTELPLTSTGKIRKVDLSHLFADSQDTTR